MTQFAPLLQCAVVGGGLLSTRLSKGSVTTMIKTPIKPPQMYSLQQLRVKGHSASESSLDGGTSHTLPHTLLRLQSKFILKDSLIQQLCHWFNDCSCPCLSWPKLLWVWFQNVRKTQKSRVKNILTHSDFVFLAMPLSQIQHRATLPSPDSLCSVLRLLPIKNVLQRAPNL